MTPRAMFAGSSLIWSGADSRTLKNWCIWPGSPRRPFCRHTRTSRLPFDRSCHWQQWFLVDRGCQLGQGHLYAKALRAVTQNLTGMARDRATPAKPVLYLLDEFGDLAQLAPIERAMGLIAGYGVQLWPIPRACSGCAPHTGSSRHLPLQCQRVPSIRGQRHRDHQPP
ncbi:hypothetical protein FVA81_03030 (plasmid) [Rhizobium sp. WL3]|nr:hypothetical protein FVA81_03030 [Rhizobium sp. WL3]